jgi:hypothetical protein
VIGLRQHAGILQMTEADVVGGERNQLIFRLVAARGINCWKTFDPSAAIALVITSRAREIPSVSMDLLVQPVFFPLSRRLQKPTEEINFAPPEIVKCIARN